MGTSAAEYPQGLTRRITPLTSERVLSTITNSTELVVEGAFQYDWPDPDFSGASNEKNGAESAAVSTYNHK